MAVPPEAIVFGRKLGLGSSEPPHSPCVRPRSAFIQPCIPFVWGPCTASLGGHRDDRRHWRVADLCRSRETIARTAAGSAAGRDRPAPFLEVTATSGMGPVRAVETA